MYCVAIIPCAASLIENCSKKKSNICLECKSGGHTSKPVRDLSPKIIELNVVNVMPNMKENE